MKKMTISIPTGLRARMRRVDHRVNWSAIAAVAFEAELEKQLRCPHCKKPLEDDPDQEGADATR